MKHHNAVTLKLTEIFQSLQALDPAMITTIADYLCMNTDKRQRLERAVQRKVEYPTPSTGASTRTLAERRVIAHIHDFGAKILEPRIVENRVVRTSLNDPLLHRRKKGDGRWGFYSWLQQHATVRCF